MGYGVPFPASQQESCYMIKSVVLLSRGNKHTTIIMLALWSFHWQYFVYKHAHSYITLNIWQQLIMPLPNKLKIRSHKQTFPVGKLQRVWNITAFVINSIIQCTSIVLRIKCLYRLTSPRWESVYIVIVLNRSLNISLVLSALSGETLIKVLFLHLIVKKSIEEICIFVLFLNFVQW